MDTTITNSENSRNSEYHVLGLKLTDKLHLKRCQKNLYMEKRLYMENMQ